MGNLSGDDKPDAGGERSDGEVVDGGHMDEEVQDVVMGDSGLENQEMEGEEMEREEMEREEMEDGDDDDGAEREGFGRRMSQQLADAVQHELQSQLQQLTNRVRRQVRQYCRTIERQYAERMQTVVSAMRHEPHTILGERTGGPGERHTPEQVAPTSASAQLPPARSSSPEPFNNMMNNTRFPSNGVPLTAPQDTMASGPTLAFQLDDTSSEMPQIAVAGGPTPGFERESMPSTAS